MSHTIRHFMGTKILLTERDQSEINQIEWETITKRVPTIKTQSHSEKLFTASLIQNFRVSVDFVLDCLLTHTKKC